MMIPTNSGIADSYADEMMMQQMAGAANDINNPNTPRSLRLDRMQQALQGRMQQHDSAYAQLVNFILGATLILCWVTVV